MVVVVNVVDLGGGCWGDLVQDLLEVVVVVDVDDVVDLGG